MSEISHEFLTRNNSDENIRFEYPAETVRGEKGEPATIRVGKVTVSDDGTADVTNTGTENDAVLNFTVPKGDKGEKGEAASIRVGEVAVSEDGTAEVTNTGTENDAVLNFTVPKGDKGEKGDPLEVGEVTAQKLAPGAPATAEITQEENVLNFTFGIPKGEKGNTGVQGKSGLNAKILAETKTTTGTEAKAEVVLVNPETNEYELHLTIPKGDKGDTAPAPEVEIKKLEWVESPEDAAVNVTLDESGKYFVDIKAPHWRGDKGEKGDGFHYVGRFDSVDGFPAQPDMLDTAVATIDGKDILYIFDGSQWQEAATLTGAKGEDGKSIKFVGYFDGVVDLIAKIPTPELNDMAVVTKDEGARYLALYTGNDWHDLAKISGDKGEKGETGNPATVKIGEVTVSDDGTAEVTNTGTESDAVLNFTVPKGDKGEKGKDGKSFTYEDITEEQKKDIVTDVIFSEDFQLDFKNSVKGLFNEFFEPYLNVIPTTFNVKQIVHNKEAEVTFSSASDLTLHLPVNHGAKYFTHYSPELGYDYVEIKNYLPIKAWYMNIGDFRSKVNSAYRERYEDYDYPTKLPLLLDVLNDAVVTNFTSSMTLEGGYYGGSAEDQDSLSVINKTIFTDYDKSNVYIVLAIPEDNDISLDEDTSIVLKEIMA